MSSALRNPLESLHAEAGEFASAQIRNIRLRDQQCRGLRLSKAPIPYRRFDHARQFRLCETFFGVSHSDIAKDIAGTVVHFNVSPSLELSFFGIVV